MKGHPGAARRLLLLRHAKSDWDATSGCDHDRPLAARGKADAGRIGRILAAVRHAPEHVITSSATRAHDTVRRAMAAGGWDAEVEVDRALYAGDPDTVLARARRAPDRARILLLAGHEPVWSALVGVLVGGGDHRMPTAAVACIHLGIERWHDLAPGRGSLAWLVTPKLLRRAGISD